MEYEPQSEFEKSWILDDKNLGFEGSSLPLVFLPLLESMPCPMSSKQYQIFTTQSLKG